MFTLKVIMFYTEGDHVYTETLTLSVSNKAGALVKAWKTAVMQAQKGGH